MCGCLCGAHMNKLARPDICINYCLPGADRPAAAQDKIIQTPAKNLKTDFLFCFLVLIKRKFKKHIDCLMSANYFIYFLL